MTSSPPVLTDEARNLALNAIRSFAKLLKKRDIALLPEVFVRNTEGVISAVVVHGGRDLKSGTAEDHLAAGRRLLERLGNRPDVVRNAALAYDAYLTSRGEKTSVIVVELLGRGVTHTFAQRYAVGRGGKVDLIGEPSYFAEPRSESSSF